MEQAVLINKPQFIQQVIMILLENTAQLIPIAFYP